MDGIAPNALIYYVGLPKNLQKYFQMVHLIDRSGISSHLLHFLLNHKTFKIKIKVVVFYSLALHCEKWPKMTIFMKAGKQEGVMPILLDFFLLLLMI